MQVCTLLQTDNHASTSPLSFYRPDAHPATQPTASKHWRHHCMKLQWTAISLCYCFQICLLFCHIIMLYRTSEILQQMQWFFLSCLWVGSNYPGFSQLPPCKNVLPRRRNWAFDGQPQGSCELTSWENAIKITEQMTHRLSIWELWFWNKQILSNSKTDFFQISTTWVSQKVPKHYCYHTHTHTRLTVLFPGLPGWAGTSKHKILEHNEQ